MSDGIPLHTIEPLPEALADVRQYRMRVEDGWMYIAVMTGANRTAISQEFVPDEDVPHDLVGEDRRQALEDAPEGKPAYVTPRVPRAPRPPSKPHP